MLLNKLRAHARSLAGQKGVVLMFELTSNEKKALNWALNQNFGSVAAQYSKILAIALKRAMKEIEPESKSSNTQ
jgi:MarR-like DNA-binding transcriptional regulator SgrR of sgrS sRNA